MVESLHANWWNVPSCDESIFFFVGEEVVSKYKRKKKHTTLSRGVLYKYGQIEHKTHETHIFIFTN
jgi:hypothetical protein